MRLPELGGWTREPYEVTQRPGLSCQPWVSPFCLKARVRTWLENRYIKHPISFLSKHHKVTYIQTILRPKLFPAVGDHPAAADLHPPTPITPSQYRKLWGLPFQVLGQESCGYVLKMEKDASFEQNSREMKKYTYIQGDIYAHHAILETLMNGLEEVRVFGRNGFHSSCKRLGRQKDSSVSQKWEWRESGEEKGYILTTEFGNRLFPSLNQLKLAIRPCKPQRKMLQKFYNDIQVLDTAYSYCSCSSSAFGDTLTRWDHFLRQYGFIVEIKLGSKTDTSNTESPSCLNTTTSPTLKPFSAANFPQPSPRIRPPLIFTRQLRSPLLSIANFGPCPFKYLAKKAVEEQRVSPLSPELLATISPYRLLKSSRVFLLQLGHSTLQTLAEDPAEVLRHSSLRYCIKLLLVFMFCIRGYSYQLGDSEAVRFYSGNEMRILSRRRTTGHDLSLSSLKIIARFSSVTRPLDLANSMGRYCRSFATHSSFTAIMHKHVAYICSTSAFDDTLKSYQTLRFEAVQFYSGNKALPFQVLVQESCGYVLKMEKDATFEQNSREMKKSTYIRGDIYAHHAILETLMNGLDEVRVFGRNGFHGCKRLGRQKDRPLDLANSMGRYCRSFATHSSFTAIMHKHVAHVCSTSAFEDILTRCGILRQYGFIVETNRAKVVGRLRDRGKWAISFTSTGVENRYIKHHRISFLSKHQKLTYIQAILRRELFPAIAEHPATSDLHAPTPIPPFQYR
nr:hypothetical protein Itr_chr08CG04600 [Ipomoea trifida]